MQKYTVVVDEEGTIYWYKEGTEILHREDGPAMEYFDGDKFWFQNNKLHRLDGPAKECSDGNKFWYQNGKLHRLNGPAVEYSNGEKYWYIEGKNHSEEEYSKKIGELNHSNDCSNKIIEIDGKKYKL